MFCTHSSLRNYNCGSGEDVYILVNTLDLGHIRMQQIFNKKTKKKDCKFYYHLRNDSVKVQAFWNSMPYRLVNSYGVSKDRSASQLNG